MAAERSWACVVAAATGWLLTLGAAAAAGEVPADRWQPAAVERFEAKGFPVVELQSPLAWSPISAILRWFDEDIVLFVGMRPEQQEAFDRRSAELKSKDKAGHFLMQTIGGPSNAIYGFDTRADRVVLVSEYDRSATITSPAIRAS